MKEKDQRKKIQYHLVAEMSKRKSGVHAKRERDNDRKQTPKSITPDSVPHVVKDLGERQKEDTTRFKNNGEHKKIENKTHKTRSKSKIEKYSRRVIDNAEQERSPGGEKGRMDKNNQKKVLRSF